MVKVAKMINVICKLKTLYAVNRSVSQPYYAIFSILYVAISVFAFLCNSLLLVSLFHYTKKKKSGFKSKSQRKGRPFRKPSRRQFKSEKTRDNLIGYLATFDLLLSLTMPFTAIDVLTNYWPLGPNSEIIVQLMRAAPTAFVYASSMIIILIAYNCYRHIIKNSKKQLSPKRTRYIVIIIVGISIVLSSPIVYFTKLEPLINDDFKKLLNAVGLVNKTEDLTPPLCSDHEEVNLLQISFVVDDWPLIPINSTMSAVDWTGNIRLYFSIMSLVAQSILPFFVISYCYYSVYKRLKRKSSIQSRVLKTAEARRRRNEREKRRNKLLITISLVYLITWLPLGILGTLADGKINFFGENPEIPSIIFMICNLLGMSSSCANPIIYGYRNKHLRKGNEN